MEPYDEDDAIVLSINPDNPTNGSDLQQAVNQVQGFLMSKLDLVWVRQKQEKDDFLDEFGKIIESMQSQISRIVADRISQNEALDHGSERKEILAIYQLTKQVEVLKEHASQLEAEVSCFKSRSNQGQDVARYVEDRLREEFEAVKEESRSGYKELRELTSKTQDISVSVKTELENMKSMRQQDMCSLKQVTQMFEKHREEVKHFVETSAAANAPSAEAAEAAASSTALVMQQSTTLVNNTKIELAKRLSEERQMREESFHEERLSRETEHSELRGAMQQLAERMGNIELQVATPSLMTMAGMSSESAVHEAASRERKEVMATIASLRGEVEMHLDDYNDHLRWGHGFTKEDADNLKAMFQRLEEEVADCSSKMKSFQSDVKKTDADREAITQKLCRQVGRLEELYNEQCETLYKLKDNFEVQTKNLDVQQLDSSAKLANLQVEFNAERSTSRTRFNALDERVTRQHADNQETLHIHAKRLEVDRGEIMTLQKDFGDIKMKLSGFQAELELFKNELHTRDEDHQKNWAQMHHFMHDAVHENANKAEQTRRDMELLRKDMGGLHSKTNNLAADIETEKSTVHTHHKELVESIRRTNDLIDHKVEDVIKKVDLHSSDMETKFSSLQEELQAEISLSARRHATLHQSHTKDHTEFQRFVQNTDQKTADCSSSIGLIQTSVSQLEAKLIASQDHLERSQRDLNSRHDRTAQSVVRYQETLTSSIQDVSRKVEQYRSEFNQLQKLVADGHGRVTKLDGEVKSFRFDMLKRTNEFGKLCHAHAHDIRKVASHLHALQAVHGSPEGLPGVQIPPVFQVSDLNDAPVPPELTINQQFVEQEDVEEEEKEEEEEVEDQEEEEEEEEEEGTKDIERVPKQARTLIEKDLPGGITFPGTVEATGILLEKNTTRTQIPSVDVMWLPAAPEQTTVELVTPNAKRSRFPKMNVERQAEIDALLQQGLIQIFDSAPEEPHVALLKLSEPIEFWPVYHGERAVAEYWSQDTATRILEHVAKFMHILYKSEILIEVHTAARYETLDEWAHELARNRADLVKASLTSLGVSGARIRVLGLPGVLGIGSDQVIIKILRF